MRTLLRLTLGLPLILANTPNLLGQSSTASNDPVAIIAGQPLSQQELLEALGPELRQLQTQEYEVKSKALESLIRLKLVQAEAKKRGISAAELIAKEVASKVAAPTDGEVEAYFWGQNRAGVRFEDVKEQYRTVLRQLKVQRASEAYADSLRAKNDVLVLLQPPRVEVAYDPARVKGNPNAPVTIVEFGDFQCPFCQKAESTVNALLAKYSGRVKLAFLDLPLSEIHARAAKAAEAARCAGEQGRFWEYHDSLFADPSKLDDASLIARAHDLKLDSAAFQSCLESAKFAAKVEADRQAGLKLGVAGTPGFFVNGVFLSGAQPQAEFEKVIDNMLSAARFSSGPAPGSSTHSKDF
jgi:protein-disulfide isomerase